MKAAYVAPFYNAQGDLASVAVDNNSRLFHARQTSPGGSWTEFAAINDDFIAAAISSVVDRNGDTMFFSIGGDGALWKFWQDGDTGDWEFESIDLGVAQTADRGKAYVSRVSVKDASGAPLAFASAKVWASAPLDATVNGLAVSLNEKNPVEFATDLMGRLTIVAPSHLLHTPILTLHMDGMADEEGLVIEPNSDIQSRLATLDASSLTQAKTTDGDSSLY